MKLLAGQLEEISLTDLRKNPGDVFYQVQMGKRFTVTKSGKVIAQIVPAKPIAFEVESSTKTSTQRKSNAKN